MSFHPEITRLSAKETWPLRQQVLWPEKELEYVKLEKDEEGIHLGIKDQDGKVISVISAFEEKDHIQFRKFATDPVWQGRGLGSLLLHGVMEEARKRLATRVWCNARVATASFYERFDMQKTDQVFYKGDIEYLIMEKWL
ncbi:MAG: GNAT family N-acetyltransferase [Bacteroidota bacterium]